MPDSVLGVDAGTGSLKAGLFGLDGALLGISRAAYPISSPESDAREQDPREWWHAFASVCRDLVDHAPASTRIRSVAVAGQAPTLAAVDADLEPTHAAITWLDSRPSLEAEQLYARLGQAVPVWGSWPSQAAWFTRNRPEALLRTRWFLGTPDYVTSRLICAPVALLGVGPAELDAGELDVRRFPPAWTPGAVIGEVSRAAAEETHLAAGTPVVGGHVDGLMGVLGSGVRRPGDGAINCGTSGTFSVVTDPPLGFPIFDLRVAGTATNTAGAALDWFAANLSSANRSYADLLACVSSVPAGAEGLLFLPHLAGERGATADPYARGAWVGLTLAHDRRHLLRSLLEGVAFSFRAMQDWLEDGGARVGDVRSVGGLTRSDVWNQIAADVLDRSVLVPDVVEAVVVGAAILAALGIGAYADLADAVRAMVHVNRRIDPDPAHAAVYAKLRETDRSLYPALRETNWRLHDLAERT